MRRLIRWMPAICVACEGPAAPAPSDPPDDTFGGLWLGIDLHLHSTHSDDAPDNPIPELLDVARARGLDAFVLTDHDNHVDGEITTWADPDLEVDDLIVLFGVELTTATGHANLFSATPWDHPALYALRDGPGAALAAEAHRQGLHLSANHPLNGDPWEFGFDIGLDSMEVWNALFPFPTDNQPSLALWDARMEQGQRLPGRGGSDCHHQTGIEAAGLNVGNPTTWIVSEDRTAEALLAGLAAGHASVTYAPTAERILLRADADGDGISEVLMGDTIPATGDPIVLRIDLDQIPEAQVGAERTITVLRNGVVWQTRQTPDTTLHLQDTPPAGERTWYRVEVHGETVEAPAGLSGLYGPMIGLTNPIHVGFDG